MLRILFADKKIAHDPRFFWCQQVAREIGIGRSFMGSQSDIHIILLCTTHRIFTYFDIIFIDEQKAAEATAEAKEVRNAEVLCKISNCPRV